MLAEERRQKVREIVEEKGKITVEDIASRFSVSAVTARSDLDVLAKRREVL
jgi:DeoR family transcriptional regulator of aga operon